MPQSITSWSARKTVEKKLICHHLWNVWQQASFWTTEGWSEHRSLNLKAADRAAGFDENRLLFDPHTYKMFVCCCRDTVCKHLRYTRSPSSTKTACLWLFKAERKCAPLWSSSAVNLFVLQIVFYQEYCYCYFLKIAKNHELSNCASFLQRNMELIKELIWKQTVNTIKILLDLELEYFKWEAQVLSFLYHPYFSLLRRKVCGRCMRIQNVIQD